MWKPKEIDKEKEKLELKNGHNRIIARLLASRSIESLDADYEHLMSPFDLHGVDEGTSLFLEVAKNKGNIGVISDYDVDGVISNTMINEICLVFGLNCKSIVPSRLEHGYGLNSNTVQAFKDKFGNEPPELLFVVDCGSNNKKEVQELKDYGVQKVIIIDHHLIDQELFSSNADVVISWHLSNCHEMCTTVQIYHFVRGLFKKNSQIAPIEFLTYAALGIIADCSPVIENNRIIVSNGLKKFSIDHIVSAGFSQLLKELKIDPNKLTQNDISFKIAPRINAIGRIGEANIAYGMMIEKDIVQSQQIIKYAMNFNNERKHIQRKIEKEIDGYIQHGNYPYGILAVDDSWHIGVVGIVASRVVEKYHKPVLVIGKNKDLFKGSGRSIPGVDIKKILDKCSHIFTNYGGHSAAVGVALDPQWLTKANKEFNKACKEYYEENNIQVEEVKHYDTTLKLKAVTDKNCEIINEYLYPFCQDNNPAPIFCLKNVTVHNCDLIEGNGWSLLKFELSQNGMNCPLKFKTFNEKFSPNLEGQTCNIYCSFPQSLGWGGVYEMDALDFEMID